MDKDLNKFLCEISLRLSSREQTFTESELIQRWQGDSDAINSRLKDDLHLEGDGKNPLASLTDEATLGTCGHMFKMGEPVYRCLTCGLDETCVLCARCFHSSHDGLTDHDTDMHVSSGVGGCCDCGDLEAWKVDLNCKFHSSSITADKFSNNSGVDNTEKVLATILDFILDTWILSPERTNAQRSTTITESYYLSQEKHTLDSSKAQVAWQLSLWNDEEHSFRDVSDNVSRLLNFSSGDGYIVAKEVDSKGRMHLASSSDLGKMVTLSNELLVLGLTNTVRPITEVAREDVAALCLEWISSIGLSLPKLTNCLGKLLLERPAFDRLHSLGLEARGLGICDEMWQLDSDLRIHWLIILDDRLPKASRIRLREITLAVLGFTGMRNSIMDLFDLCYPRFALRYAQDDVERHLNVLNLSVQLFTVPSIAKRVVAESDLPKRILILFDLVLQHSKKGESTVIGQNVASVRLPTYIWSTEVHALGSERLEGLDFRWYSPMLADLGYLLSAPSVRSDILPKILANPTSFLFQGFFQIFARLQGISCQKRKVGSHVLYESETWTYAMNLMLHLTSLIELLPSCFQDEQSCVCFIKAQMTSLIALYRFRTSSSEDGESDANKKARWRLENGRWLMLALSSETEGATYHHPLNWILARGFLRLFQLNTSFHLKRIFIELSGERHEVDEMLAAVVDDSIMALHLAAETKEQLWVRNGLHMREQLACYQGAVFGGMAYESDLFLLQIFASYNPYFVFEALLSRFNLQELNDKTHLGMLFHFLAIVGHVYGFRELLNGQDRRSTLEQLVVHYLGEKPLSFTKLVAKCRPYKEEEITAVVSQVADLDFGGSSSGLSSASVGVYRIKSNPAVKCLLHPLFAALDKPWDVYTAHCGAIYSPKMASNEATKGLALMPEAHPAFFKVIDFTLSEWLRSFQTSKSATTELEKLAEVSMRILQIAVSDLGDNFTKVVERSCEGLIETLVLMNDAVTLEGSQAAKGLKPLFTAVFKSIKSLFPLEYQKKVLERSKRTVCGEDQSSSETSIREKKRQAKEKQAAILAELAKQQQEFIQKTENSSNKKNGESSNGAQPSNNGMLNVKFDTSSDGLADTEDICIFCMDAIELKEHLSTYEKSMIPVVLGYSCLSNFLMEEHPINLAAEEGLSDGVNPREKIIKATWNAESSFAGIYFRSCGHQMHSGCYKTFHRSVLERADAQNNLDSDGMKCDFLCPLCKTLCNFVVPVIPKTAVAVETGEVCPNDFFGNKTLGPRIAKKAPRDKRFSEDLKVFVEVVADLDTIKALALVSTQLPLAESTKRFIVDKPVGIASLLLKSVCYTIRSVQAQMQTLGDKFSINNAQLYFLQQLLKICCTFCFIYGSKYEDSLSSTFWKEGELLLLAQLQPLGLHPITECEDKPLERRYAELLYSNPWDADPDQFWSTVDPEQFLQKGLIFYVSATLFSVKESVADNLDSIKSGVKWLYCVESYRIIAALCAMKSEYFLEVDNSTEYRHDLCETERAVLYAAYESMFARISEKNGCNNFVKCDANTFLQLFIRNSHCMLQQLQLAIWVLYGEKVEEVYDARQPDELWSLFEIPSFGVIFSSFQEEGAAHSASDSLHRFLTKSLECQAFYVVQKKSHSLPYTKAYSLIPLCRELNQLLEIGLTAKCEKCKMVPYEPAVCMQCGVLVCAKGICCGDVEELGECNMHLLNCTCNYGIFLLFREAKIVLLYDGAGWPISAPYRDSHGELGSSSHRRPMFLLEAKYNELNRLYLTQSIPSEVAQHGDTDYLINYWLSF